MLYYGLPSAWDENVERDIMRVVGEQLEGVKSLGVK